MALNHLLFQKKSFDMDTLDLAQLTTFNPLNELVTIPVEDVADEDEELKILKIEKRSLIVLEM